MIFRLMVLLACIYAFMTYGIDGFRVSLQGQNPKTYTIDQIERGELKKTRYVKVSGYTDGAYVYTTRDETSGEAPKSVEGIEYVLLSEGEFAKVVNAAVQGKTNLQTLATVIAKDDSVDSACMSAEDDCLQAGPSTIEGVVQYGFEGLPDETKNLLQEGNQYKISEHIIYITKGSKPNPVWVPILAMIASVVVFLLTLASFAVRRR